MREIRINKEMTPPLKRPVRRGPLKTTPKERVLAQWRRVDVVPLERAAAIRARKAGEVMPKLMTDLRLEGRRSEAEIVRVWNQALDPNLTAHAQPAGLRKGTLFVVVDSSAWLSEIVRYRRQEILERLQHSFGAELIKKISYRVG
jgi:hypothetical protein